MNYHVDMEDKSTGQKFRTVCYLSAKYNSSFSFCLCAYVVAIGFIFLLFFVRNDFMEKTSRIILTWADLVSGIVSDHCLSSYIIKGVAYILPCLYNRIHCI